MAATKWGVMILLVGFPAIIITSLTFKKAALNLQCPCSDPSLCDPVTVVHEKEIYAFCNKVDANAWKKFDYDKVTTIALDGFYDPQLVCLAHQNNVRVVNTVDISADKLPDVNERKKWITEQINDVGTKFLDGINIDFEDSFPQDSPQRNGLTDLVRESKSAFLAAFPYSQVTFDIAWNPTGVDGRFFDAVGLADAADFLFVMSYDEQSQITEGDCTARANSGINKTISGLQEFLDLGIPAEKLVLGVPWYGYNYPCVQLQGNTCYIPLVPFRGVNCSDAAGTQYNYADIIQFLKNSSSGRLWDPTTLSPYFNIEINGTDHQIWYDDPESLTYKYDYAIDNGFKGVGMWNIAFLDYNDTETAAKQRQQMWDALPNYKAAQNNMIE